MLCQPRRDDAIHRFRTDPEVQVFLMSLKAGGIGLNLTEASLVVLLDPWCVQYLRMRGSPAGGAVLPNAVRV